MEQNNWVRKMNELGANQTPFLFVVDFEMEHPQVIPLSEVNPLTLLFDFCGVSNAEAPKGRDKLINRNLQFEKFPIPFDTFEKSFNNVQQHLVYGNSFLTNLTFPTPIQTNLSLKEIFFASLQPYKLWMKDQFVVFSPEKFIRISAGKIHSFPMKGTIDASIPNAKNKILEDKKEAAEHATIVDLIRNDLSIVASEVTVENYRYIETIHTNQKDLLQVSSHISGQMGAGWQNNLGDLLFKLLPAGSISGAPKDKTVEIIHESELDKRGYYTGVMGIFDGNTLDSAVMIRFVENQNGQLVFRSGGGITAQSNARDEYNEMVDKVYFPFKES